MSDLLLIIGEIEAEKTKLCIACTEKGIPEIATLVESYTQNIVDIIAAHINDDKLGESEVSE